MNKDHFKADRKDEMKARMWPSVLVASALIVLPGLVMAATDKTESAPQSIGQKIDQANAKAKDKMAAATKQVKDSCDIRCSKGVREPSVPVSAPDGNILLTGVSRSPSKELFGDRP